MENLQESFQKFLTVADSLGRDIVSGIYPYGKPFLSRSEICSIYKISLKTAHKVQKELCKRGLIAANRGRAFTVCNPQERGGIPLHEVRLLRQNQPFVTDYVMDELSAGIRKQCQQKNLAFSEIYLELLDKFQHRINAAGGSEPGQGIVLLPYRSIMCRGAGYFLKYWQPYRVTVDFPLPGTSGIMMDEMDMTDKVFEHAHKNNALSIMQIPYTANAWNPLFSGQCFRFGELKAASLKMQHLSTFSSEINEVSADIRRLHPDALLFHDCDARSVAYIIEQLDYQPLLYFVCRSKGMAQYCSQISCAHCYIYDYEKIGAAAVDLLALPYKGSPKRELVYIKGELKQ